METLTCAVCKAELKERDEAALVSLGVVRLDADGLPRVATGWREKTICVPCLDKLLGRS